MRRSTVISGTHKGLEGIIICGDQKITFMYKSPGHEVVKRWFNKELSNLSIYPEKAYVEFNHFGKEVEFSNLSLKALMKLEKYLKHTG